MLDEAVSLSHSGHLLLLGDFNYPHVDYNNFEVLGPVESDAIQSFSRNHRTFICAGLLKTVHVFVKVTHVVN